MGGRAKGGFSKTRRDTRLEPSTESRTADGTRAEYTSGSAAAAAAAAAAAGGTIGGSADEELGLELGLVDPRIVRAKRTCGMASCGSARGECSRSCVATHCMILARATCLAIVGSVMRVSVERNDFGRSGGAHDKMVSRGGRDAENAESPCSCCRDNHSTRAISLSSYHSIPALRSRLTHSLTTHVCQGVAYLLCDGPDVRREARGVDAVEGKVKRVLFQDGDRKLDDGPDGGDKASLCQDL